MGKTAKGSFEDALAKLETIVKRMEEGEMSLEESLRAFEEGVTLTKFCAQKLEEAQRRVEILVEQNGELKTIPFADGNEER